MSVGQRARPGDWQERTTGASAYAGDVRLPGLCVGRVLRSPHAHARIRALDLTAARRVAGVVAVISADDFGDARYEHSGGPLSDRRPLARERVRFVGEEVAAVAAETPEAAEEALRAIRVDYRPLRAACDVAAARRPRAPRIHDRPSRTNVALSISRAYGDPPAAGGDGDCVTVRGAYRFGRQAHACMETNGTVARWDAAAARLHVWVSTQSPYFVRKELAHVLGLTMDQVVTHEVAVGGGFGSKSKIGEHEALAAMLAIRGGRPVRLVLSREEEFAATKARHSFDVDLATTATRDGGLVRRDARVVVDSGAYLHSGPSVMAASVGALASMYRTGGVGVEAELVDTNKVPGGQFRGYGVPQAVFAIESQMDELAGALGVDPIDLRLRNLLEEGDVTHAGYHVVSTRLAECLEIVRRELDWDRKRRAGGAGRGVGVAVSLHVSGTRTYPDAHRSQAGVDVDAGGRVTVRFGGADPGTGQRTVLAQVAATELGVEASSVGVRLMDSDETPFDMGAWSSRGTVMGGHAVRSAARRAAGELRRRAGEKLGVPGGEVTLAGGEARARGDAIALGDLVRLAGDPGGVLATEGEFVADTELFDPASGTGNLSPTYSFAAHGVEVAVDPGTGKIRVLDYVAAHDSGVALNPTAVEGQIVGGVVMGLGAALGEELRYEAGRTVNPAYLHYPLPRSADLPPIRPFLVEARDPKGPYGAKGVGEISLVPVPAAVANAVAHACGRRVRSIPITPDRLLERRAPARARERTRAYGLWRRPGRWWISLMRWAYPRGLHGLLEQTGRRWGSALPPRRVERLDRPERLEDALGALGEGGRALAGGTDLLPARQQGLANPRALVDLTTVRELRTAPARRDGEVVLGGATTLAELSEQAAGLGLPVLAETIETIASAQVRAVATVGGNLCQQKRCWFFRNGFDCYKRAGPACPCYAVDGDHRFHHAVLGAHRCQAVTPSDLATVLVALDASVVLSGQPGRRELPLERLYTGPGEVALAPGEVVELVRVPARAGRRCAFEKLALWHGDFALVSAGVSLARGPEGRVREARAVLGGVAPVPWRARDVEDRLRGGDPEAIRPALERLSRAWVRHAHPLPRNAWKVEAACTVLARALDRALEAEGEPS